MFPQLLLLATCAVCLLQPVNSQQTGVTCSTVIPIDVPRDPSIYWGTWFVIGTCTACTDPSNVCSQVAYEPVDSSTDSTNVTYIGSFQTDSPEGPLSQAFGVMSPINLETFNPMYRFDLDLGFAVIPSNFWILTTAGDGSGISAIVTMSCLLDGSDQQLFFLSRKPYFVPPVTFDALVAQTRRAITNYDQFNITTVQQAQGWCGYALTETSFSTATDICDCGDDDGIKIEVAEAFAILAALFSLAILAFVVHSKFFAKPHSDGLKNSLI